MNSITDSMMNSMTNSVECWMPWLLYDDFFNNSYDEFHGYFHEHTHSDLDDEFND